jgi:hypothetical protein
MFQSLVMLVAKIHLRGVVWASGGVVFCSAQDSERLGFRYTRRRRQPAVPSLP